MDSKQNKTKTVFLATLGGIEAVFSIISPILVVSLWVEFMTSTNDLNWLFYGLGFCAALFRGIKIGWFKK